MTESERNFTSRQYMVSPDFEIFHYKDQPSLEVLYHHHDFYEIYYFISGKVNYIIEGQSYSLRHDDILLINNQELHKPDISNGALYERIVLWVNPEFIRKISTGQTNLLRCFERTSKNRPNLLRPDTELLSSIKNTLFKLNLCSMTQDFGSEILQQAFLTELIVLINRAFLEVYRDSMTDDITSNPKIIEIIRHINKNIAADLSLDSLSEQFFISKYHLARQFKKFSGFTLYNYIQRKRLIYAKSLLSEDLNLTEISRRCGFHDYSNFIRSFKKAYHLSPKRYARQQSTL